MNEFLKSTKEMLIATLIHAVFMTAIAAAVLALIKIAAWLIR